METAKSPAGFTLVELLVVIVLVAVMAHFAMPSLTKVIDNSYRSTAASDMISLINIARNTAVMERSTVTVCPLDETKSCSHNWSARPITVFRDPEADRVLQKDSDVIRTLNTQEKGKWKANTSSRPYFRFFATGIANYAIGNMTWCPNDNDTSNAIHIIINMGGRLRLAKDRDGDGVVENTQGDPVSC
jgi:type IV fimbrial biogenesis protein FimT